MIGNGYLVRISTDRKPTRRNNRCEKGIKTGSTLNCKKKVKKNSAGNLDAANVEDAIAKIYTDTISTRTLTGVFEEDPDTTTDLTWGYFGGIIGVDNVVTTIEAGTIGLTDDATNYVVQSP